MGLCTIISIEELIEQLRNPAVNLKQVELNNTSNVGIGSIFEWSVQQ
jgi:hypothetical protein